MTGAFAVLNLSEEHAHPRVADRMLQNPLSSTDVESHPVCNADILHASSCRKLRIKPSSVANLLKWGEQTRPAEEESIIMDGFKGRSRVVPLLWPENLGAPSPQSNEKEAEDQAAVGADCDPWA